MNTFRTKKKPQKKKQKTKPTNLRGGKKEKKTLLYSFIVAFTVVLRMQTGAFCVFKKKRKKQIKK